jgi:serine/threonine-protein kinase
MLSPSKLDLVDATLMVLGVAFSVMGLLTAREPGENSPALLAAKYVSGPFAAAAAALASHVLFGLRKKADDGKHVGPYTLVEKIAAGGMGVVYQARHPMLQRPVAIKLLRPEIANDANLARFEREAQITSELTHPNTVAVFDYGRTSGGASYYAMEYLEGMTLEDLVANHGPQPPARVVHILAQASSALAEAHAKGLVHRDVKPANIILCERGGVADVVKVIDFGLVKELASATDVSDEGTLTGTPLYLSPEAIENPRAVDARGDVYALGAVGYYLLTGHQVFGGSSLVEVCEHHLHSAPMPPSQRLGAPLPDDLESILLRCLEKDPAARPRDALAVSAALATCADAKGWSADEANRRWEEEARAA